MPNSNPITSASAERDEKSGPVHGAGFSREGGMNRGHLHDAAAMAIATAAAAGVAAGAAASRQAPALRPAIIQ